MPFSVNKWQILQVVSRNIKNDYEMRGVKIKIVHSVKDLGVTVASNLKFSAVPRGRHQSKQEDGFD